MPGTKDQTETDANANLLAVENGLIKVSEAAEFLSVSRGTLYSLMESGKLAFCKIGKSRRIPRRVLKEFAANSLRTGQPESIEETEGVTT